MCKYASVYVTKADRLTALALLSSQKDLPKTTMPIARYYLGFLLEFEPLLWLARFSRQCIILAKIMEILKLDTVKNSVARIEECLAQAGRFYAKTFWISEILFDLSGRAAGMFCVRKNRHYIRINRTLLDANPDEILKQTIPHEVAHLVARQIHERSMGHGPEWRAIMRDCYSLVPDRCHAMDTSVSSKQPYVYTCACNTFTLSTRIHNQILIRPGCKVCVKCKEALIFSHTEVIETPALVMDILFVSAGSEALIEGDLAKVTMIVGKHRVGRLILGPGFRSSTAAELLRKKLGVPKEACAVHENEFTLPGAVTHAIIIACNGNDRAGLAATVFRDKGVRVRLLSRKNNTPA